MKIIGSTQALSAARFEPTSILPIDGASLPSIVDKIMHEFKFRIEPNVQQSDNPIPLPLTLFKNGELIADGRTIGIVGLIISHENIMAMTTDTDLSDIVLTHLKAYLDETFQFRFHSQEGVRSWISNLVFSVEGGFAAHMNMLARVESVLQKMIPNPSPNLPTHQFKRVTFGRDFGRMAPANDFENSDFIIERRAGVPYSDNCYYSAAALKTSEHIAILEEIERMLSSAN